MSRMSSREKDYSLEEDFEIILMYFATTCPQLWILTHNKKRN